MLICHACGKEVKIAGHFGRDEICPHCRGDLHCCRNCSFYDEHAQNKCHEPATEWVSDRDKSNFCEYFSFKESKGAGRERRQREDAMAKLEALFKKK